MDKEQIEEVASLLAEIAGKSFYDVVVNVLNCSYYSDEWDVTDEDIRDIKDELIRLLKL
jgi:hypothetical protein